MPLSQEDIRASIATHLIQPCRPICPCGFYVEEQFDVRFHSESAPAGIRTKKETLWVNSYRVRFPRKADSHHKPNIENQPNIICLK